MEFANVIYASANGVAALDLSMKIYKSDGDTEFNDAEIKLIRACQKSCTPQFIDSLNRVLDNSEQSDKTE